MILQEIQKVGETYREYQKVSQELYLNQHSQTIAKKRRATNYSTFEKEEVAKSHEKQIAEKVKRTEPPWQGFEWSIWQGYGQ